MKPLLFIAIVVLVGCNSIGGIVPRSFSVGDTVVVDVVGHGGSVGIVKKVYDGDYYVAFFNCNCNNFYPSYDIHPYSQGWNDLTKP